MTHGSSRENNAEAQELQNGPVGDTANSKETQEVSQPSSGPASVDESETVQEKPHRGTDPADEFADLPPIRQAAARRAKAAEGGMFDTTHTSSKEPASPTTKRQRIIRTLVVALAIAVGAFVLAMSGSGLLNVAVLSESGTADGSLVDVSLYSGDVTAQLTDSDPSNDPEPIEVHQIEVGQRTSFNVQGFGVHTVDADFVSDAPVAEPDPVTVSMFGIDLRSTVTMA